MTLQPTWTSADILIGEPLGVVPGPWAPCTRPPFEALTSAIAETVADGPCCVAFSGGRDSSLVLAAAVAAARSSGSPPPVPVTLRFDFADADETEWQELVVRHLGLDDWIRVPVSGELDIVADRSTTLLRRFGLIWPFNLAFLDLCMEIAGGGVLLTGLDGDMLLDTWTMRGLSRLARGERRPWRGDLRSLLHAATPARRRGLPADWVRYVGSISWLTPRGEELLLEEVRAWLQAEPATWPGFVRWHHDARRTTFIRHHLGQAGAVHGVRVDHPMLDQRFLAALGHHHRVRGPGSRDRAMRDLVGHLLPDRLCTRRSKGGFDEAFVTDHFRAYARAWTGTGVDTELVDPEALQRAWLADPVDLGTATLAHLTWLHAHGLPVPVPVGP